MSDQQSAPAAPEERSQYRNARSGGRLLLLARLGWSVTILVDVAIFVFSVPALYTLLHRPCPSPTVACLPAQLSLVDFRALGGAGPRLEAYVVFALVTVVTTSLVSTAVGALIAWRKWGDPMALFVSLALITNAPISLAFGASPTIVFGAAHPIHVAEVFALSGPVISVLGSAVNDLFYPMFAIFQLTFPTGRFAPRWSAVIVLLWIVADVLFFVRVPFVIILPFLFALGVSTAAIQVYRYARRYTPVQRQQTKWVVVSTLVALALYLVYTVAPVFWPALNTPGSAYRLAQIAALMLTGPLFSLGVGIAILRYRLYDIDIIINRTLVYGALTACVIGVYVLIVGYLGVALRVGANPVISLVAAAVVAVLFQPLRERLQRGVNRLMFGERDTPYAVLARLDGRLVEALPAETALNTIVATVAAALKLPYAAITLAPPGASDTSGTSGTNDTSSSVGERVAAEHGTPACFNKVHLGRGQNPRAGPASRPLRCVRHRSTFL